MSFCPTDDIHSIYLDNELPAVYKAEYEAHLNSCPECQKKLNKLKALHELFDSDSKAITPDNHYLEQSYDRLMSRMAYTKVVKKSEKKSHSNITFTISAVAAAAVFALIIPIRLVSDKGSIDQQNFSVASVAAQPSTNVSVGGGNGVVISGNIHGSVMAPNSVNYNYGNSFTQNVNSGNVMTSERMFFTDVDVFRPAFNGDNTFSIKITVPGVNTNVITSDANIPEDEAGQTE